ncbi:MAG: sucrose-6-phosphate hydrolase [Acidimicrobiales bacterium]
MGRPYGQELTKLSTTFDFGSTAPVDALVEAVRGSAGSPARIVGSGGSLSVAHLHASLHVQMTGLPAAATTPLEALRRPWGRDSATWFITAGGRNVDIRTSVGAEVDREPKSLSILCGARTGPLADIAKRHPFVNYLPYEGPAGRDGFLATNSALLFSSLVTRSYEEGLISPDAWAETQELMACVLRDQELQQGWRREALKTVGLPHLVVLHGPATSVGAVDIESKFTEAGLANVQVADYRNFAHGRHHWLARHENETGVLALASVEDEKLMRRTLEELPSGTLISRVAIPGEAHRAALVSLVAALTITGVAGSEWGVDPGRPLVPPFGRRLYHLTGWRPSRRRRSKLASERGVAAIERKACRPVADLERSGELDLWLTQLDAFVDRLEEARFDALVLDYDGTLVETRDRYDPPTGGIAAELVRLLESGAQIAVATGRGSSVRRDLQAVLPERFWPEVVIGYYNGSQVARLDDLDWPHREDPSGPALQTVFERIREDPFLTRLAEVSASATQVRVVSRDRRSAAWVFSHLQDVVGITHEVSLMTSGHSIDIVAGSAGKLSVIQEGWANKVLAIGDQGQRPGNDADLLAIDHALSVDVVSPALTSCWNLGQRGQKGPGVCLEYLRALNVVDGRLAVTEGALR